MEEEQVGAQAESPAAEQQQDVTPESSQAAPAETTAKQVEQTQEPEIPFHQHPRWKEIMEEREYYKQLAMKAVERQNTPQNPPPPVDEYAGLSDEERRFYERIEKIAEKKAQRLIAEKEPQITRELQETRQILATLAYERFQAKHPDVVPNSPEEAQIAQYYNRGVSLDDAYKIVMFDKKVSANQRKVQEDKQVKIQQKVAANLETATIPPNSGLPQNKKMTVREFIEQHLQKEAAA